MMEVLVSAEEDAEVRRISITNAGRAARTIDITSYAELALIAGGRRHRAPRLRQAVRADRAARGYGRDPGDEAAADADGAGDLGGASRRHRARRAGRHRDGNRPRAVPRPRSWRARPGRHDGGRAVGHDRHRARRRLRASLPGDRAARRDGARRLLDDGRGLPRRRSSTASTSIGTSPPSTGRRPWPGPRRRSSCAISASGRCEADLFQRLAGHLIFAGPALRPGSDVIRQGAGPQSGLWGQGISGDLPILLLRIRDADDLERRAGTDARARVFPAEAARGRPRDPERACRVLLAGPADRAGDPGAHPAAHAAGARRASPRAPCSCCAPTWSRRRRPHCWSRWRASCSWRTGAGCPSSCASRRRSHGRGRRRSRGDPGSVVPPVPRLEFFNGLGGFADDGREYVIVLGPGQTTPAPWINVVANPGFGFLVSAEGGGYSWAGNSRENQLTPWSNDPGHRPLRRGVLSPRRRHRRRCGARPRRRAATRPRPMSSAMGGATAGSTAWRSGSRAACCRRCRPTTRSSCRGCSCTTSRAGPARSPFRAYVEWVLGPSRTATAPFVTTEIDAETGAMFARNPWSAASGPRVAFADLGGAQTELDRRSARVHRPRWHARRAGGGRRVGAALRPRGRRARSLRGDADHGPPAAPAPAPRSCSCSARARTARTRAAWSHATARPISTPCWTRSASNGTACSAPCR